MLFSPTSRTLRDEEGRLLKRFSCPKGATAADLRGGACRLCDREVLRLDRVPEAAGARPAPRRAGPLRQRPVQHAPYPGSSPVTPYDQPRRIATARTKMQLTEALRQGLRPLVLPVVPNPEIRKKFQVLQSRDTGEVVSVGDYRAGPRGPECEVVIPWTYRYPYSWPLPYAAYLLPPDLAMGEEVFLEDLIEDLIEDVVGAAWNQGDRYRLESCRARWTGTGFELLREEGPASMMIG